MIIQIYNQNIFIVFEYFYPQLGCIKTFPNSILGKWTKAWIMKIRISAIYPNDPDSSWVSHFPPYVSIEQDRTKKPSDISLVN